ncbi:hypothetical protein Airi01_007300 [Actinoallomurus iriomotensis]|uniref:Uncharacterized protein n=2 Tax=Actinoallomurus iriomotensis TaxID=478107 RepID=A0A9W6RB94_9ACTN|nr:hypothetical protein Airi01_007300 [Actinoallomurus iriomotensis]
METPGEAMACWTPRRRPDIRRSGRVRDEETGPPASAAASPAVRRVSLARIREQGRFSALLERAARLASRAPIRRRDADDTSRFMDYGPDWPPAPAPPRRRHPLLRRCVAAVVLYAVIWALGSALLELRMFQLRKLGGGAPVTTYTTVTEPRHR